MGFGVIYLQTKASDDKNFVAKTERKFEKSIRVNWFSLGDVMQDSSQCTNTRRNVKHLKAGKIDDRVVDGPSESSGIESISQDSSIQACMQDLNNRRANLGVF